MNREIYKKTCRQARLGYPKIDQKALPVPTNGPYYDQSGRRRDWNWFRNQEMIPSLADRYYDRVEVGKIGSFYVSATGAQKETFFMLLRQGYVEESNIKARRK